KKPSPSDGERKRILKEVLEELDLITKDINELEKYSRINYTGFLKIAKKHDRKRAGRVSSIRPLVKSRMADVPFNNEDYSPLLYRLSAMYSFARQNLEGQDRPLSLVESIAGEESYITHKFWVHMDNLLEVKTIILRRLPVLVYNPQTEKIAEGSQQDPSITSIYFDNPDFKLYSNKVEHKTDASNLRLRWYGKLSQKPEIMFEKKTVKTENTSADERFPIKDKYIQPFIKGEYHMEKAIEKRSSRQVSEEALQSFKRGIDDIQSFIKDNDLQPVLRANYTRTAFQIPGDDRVRISIDTNLAFIREDAIDADRPCRDPEDWHRRDIDDAEMEWPFKSIRKGELATFPHAVLEIKVKNDKDYEWIDDLMNSHLVKEAPKFSKFVHGVASLFEDNVNTFPFWLSTLEEDIRQDPETAFEKEQAKKQKQQEDELAVGSLMKSKSHSSYKPGGLSPVGSPTDKTGSYLDRRASRQSAAKNGGQSLGSVARSQPTGMTAVADEPDSDDDGPQAPNTEIQATTQSGLQTLFPSFSTSKYARNRRDRDMPLPPGVQKPEYWIKDQGPVKVEAKVWLANQRTFIKWQHITVLLASLSLGLFNAAGENNNIARALALVYTLAAVFTGVWGWGVYQWRSRLIQQRSGKDFDALTGPVVVCVGLFVALILNFAFKYQEMRHNAEHHHGHHSNQTHSIFEMDELKA
ncbi:SPX-domain-containing protein, partial [Aureobasidium melanogenum]